MDVMAQFLEPDMLFLAAGAATLGIGAALVHTYRALQNGKGSFKRMSLAAAASACLIAGPLLIIRGF